MISLPEHRYLSINRCNLPAKILGSLTFQQHPAALYIDGVHELHQDFFQQLDKIDNINTRTSFFENYMRTFFAIEEVEQATSEYGYNRIRADYNWILRGWLFDSNKLEGAVLKGWTESRFGLLPCWHKSFISNPDDEAYAIFMHERTAGIYNTNAIEAQLDLLYSYSQYELTKRYPDKQHLVLYRGTENLSACMNNQENIILLNNMNSLTNHIERADEFGTSVLELSVPISKIFYFSGLLPGKLHGESEVIAIGGLYRFKPV